MSVNRIFLLGNVGRVDARDVNGNKVVNFSLATSERYKNRSGEQVENTTWHNVQVWGKTAEFVEKYVSKGCQVYVEGSIVKRKYTDKEGNDRESVEVKADSVQNLTRKDRSDEEEENEDEDAPDDLPF